MNFWMGWFRTMFGPRHCIFQKLFYKTTVFHFSAVQYSENYSEIVWLLWQSAGSGLSKPRVSTCYSYLPVLPK
jgi:hypothetical protein